MKTQRRFRLMWNALSTVFLLFVFALVAASAHEPSATAAQPPWQEATAWPSRIIVSPGETPQSSLTVTWRTDATVSSAIAELVEASGDSRFDAGAKAFAAKYERVDLEGVNYAFDRSGSPNHGLGVVHHHSVVFKGLKPDTLYTYRVRGARGHWSEWFQTRTAPQSGPVTFLYYGDAQYGILSHASRIFRQGILSAPSARFILHAGDLVNKGDRDAEWAEWFEASGFIHAMVPVLPVAGNHEYLATKEGGSKDGKAVLTDLWRPQFTLPVEKSLPEALHETVYDVRYTEDLHIFVLDSSNRLWREQMRWLEKAAGDSDAKWKIVGMHHSPFRPGIQGYRNNPARGEFHRQRQTQFIRAAEKAGIDLVLAGHNHSYTRASIGEDAGPGLPSPSARMTLETARGVEMIVVVSISGAMSGEMTAERFDRGNSKKFGDDIALERWANNTPTYQVISVDGDMLTYKAYLGTAELYDQFSAEKLPSGEMVLTNGEAAFGPVRSFETTGPYIKKDDLR